MMSWVSINLEGDDSDSLPGVMVGRLGVMSLMWDKNAQISDILFGQKWVVLEFRDQTLSRVLILKLFYLHSFLFLFQKPCSWSAAGQARDLFLSLYYLYLLSVGSSEYPDFNFPQRSAFSAESAVCFCCSKTVMSMAESTLSTHTFSLRITYEDRKSIIRT